MVSRSPVKARSNRQGSMSPSLATSMATALTISCWAVARRRASRASPMSCSVRRQASGRASTWPRWTAPMVSNCPKWYSAIVWVSPFLRLAISMATASTISSSAPMARTRQAPIRARPMSFTAMPTFRRISSPMRHRSAMSMRRSLPISMATRSPIQKATR